MALDDNELKIKLQEWKDRQRKDDVKYMIMGGISLLVFLSVWQIAVLSGLASERLLPPPTAIFKTFLDKFTNPDPDGNLLGINILASLQVSLSGFFAALIIGIPLGLFMGWWKHADSFLRPIFELIRPVPPIAWIPIVVVWMGIGLRARALIIFFTSFVPCVINSYTGIRLTNQTLINVSKTFGASYFEMFYKVGIPSSMPMVFAGIRVALGNSWSCLVAAEMLAASAGLGYMIQYGRMVARPDIVIVGMLTIGSVGAILAALLQFVENNFLRWKTL